MEVEDGCVILSRKITQSRAVGRVNGEAVSVSANEGNSLISHRHPRSA